VETSRLLALEDPPKMVARSVPTRAARAYGAGRDFKTAGFVAGGLAYTGYRLANPHHCSADYSLGTAVSNPASRTPTCN
jgi:hypothetical protein